MAKIYKVPSLFKDINLSANRDVQRHYSYMPVRDPDWKYVDAAGHGHFADRDKYPTLKWVYDSDERYFDEFEGENCHYECQLCGEWIVPGTKTSGPFQIAGPVNYEMIIKDYEGNYTEILTYQFGEDEFNDLEKEVKKTIRNFLEPHLVQTETSIYG